MVNWLKVLTFENEVEARILQSLLEERGIPHVVSSYHDTAYDGLYQLQKGWGFLRAPRESAEEIRSLYENLGQAEPKCETPPPEYKKKIINPGGDYPLSRWFSPEQIARRITFYEDLNRKRDGLCRKGPWVRRRVRLYGWDDTTTVRVYMRETVGRICRELFFSDYGLEVTNVYPDRADRDHGHVEFTVHATAGEVDMLLSYLAPGASYFVYDGEEARYVPGDTASSDFIIAGADDPVRPLRYWRRSQSFIGRVEVEDEPGRRYARDSEREAPN